MDHSNTTTVHNTTCIDMPRVVWSTWDQATIAMKVVHITSLHVVLPKSSITHRQTHSDILMYWLIHIHLYMLLHTCTFLLRSWIMGSAEIEGELLEFRGPAWTATHSSGCEVWCTTNVGKASAVMQSEVLRERGHEHYSNRDIQHSPTTPYSAKLH